MMSRAAKAAAALTVVFAGLILWVRGSCLFAWDVYGGRGWAVR
jgi:hypothetical protein